MFYVLVMLAADKSFIERIWWWWCLFVRLSLRWSLTLREYQAETKTHHQKTVKQRSPSLINITQVTLDMISNKLVLGGQRYSGSHGEGLRCTNRYLLTCLLVKQYAQLSSSRVSYSYHSIV